MRSRYSVATAISTAIIVVFVITLTAAQAGSDSSQSSAIITLASGETVNNAENNWNPFRAAKRAAGAAVSGARKVTEGIAGTIGALFGGEVETASKDGKSEVSTVNAVSPAQEAPVVTDGLAKDDTIEASKLASPTQAPLESQVKATPVKNETALKANEDPAHTPGDPATTKVAAKVEEIASHPKCEKAKKTIGTYAFTNIEAKSCEGKVYLFSASREGGQFSVKVSANGELLEVEKLEPGSIAKNDGKAQQKFPSLE